MTIEELIAQAESGLTAQFARIDRMEEIGTRRVLDAFREHQVAYRHFAPTTGYGYDDVGRDTLEKIFAELFGTQAAIVRPQIASGTHAISLCLFGLVLPGDDIVSATGMPYDTLQDIIGWGEGVTPMLAERLETEIKYAGYIARQDRMIRDVARHEKTLIPDDFEYADLTGLTLEAREKLAKIRPRTLAQAGRIPGVSPSDLAQLSIALMKAGKTAAAE